MTDQPPVGAEGSQGGQEATSCYRHPDREAHIRCVRCDRRICPDCMISASVGFQCPECVAEGNKGVRRARTVFGGQLSGDPGYVSKILIGLNVLAYIAQLASPGFTERFYNLGRAIDPATFQVIGVAEGEVYRLLTSAFLHDDQRFFHILLNMYALYLFGPAVEGALGRVRFVALYLVSALGGSAVSYAFSNPAQPSLGASGAVFGLMGAFLVISRRMRQDTRAVLVLLAINLAYGFLPGTRIDWRAHVGGLIAGALCAVAFAYAPKRRQEQVQVAGVVAVLLVEVAIVVWRTAALT